MHYGLFIGETLADSLRTRRATWQDLRAQTLEEVLTFVREAMGEPTSELSQKYIVLSEEPGVGKSRIMDEFALAFAGHDVEDPLVRRYQEKGFKVDVARQEEKNLVLIVTHHGEDHPPTALRELISRLGKKDLHGKYVLLDACHSSDSEFFQELMAAEFGFCEKRTSGSPHEAERVRIGLGAYLRSMWTLFWTALLHPFTTTVVDLSTGRRVAELSVPFHEWEASFSNGQEESANG